MERGFVIIYSNKKYESLSDFEVYNGCYYIGSEKGTYINIKNNKYYIDMSGVGVVNNRFIVNSKDLINYIEKDIDTESYYKFGENIRGAVAITVIDIEKQQFVVLPDPLGYAITFYYRDDNIFAISSDLKSLVKYISKIGIKINKSIEFLSESIATARGVFFRSSYEEVKSLKSFQFVLGKKSDIRIQNYDYKLDIFKNNEAYEDLLEKASIEIIENIKAVSEYNNKGYKIAHLTGGFDSRLVLSAILSCNCEKDFFFYSSGRPDFPDRSIAERICGDFDLMMTEYSGLDKKEGYKNIQEHLLDSLDFSEGLLSTTFNRKLIKNDNIVLSGGLGECYRSSFGKLVENFNYDMCIYEILEKIWGKNLSYKYEDSLFNNNFIEKVAKILKEEIESAREDGIREDAILDYIYIKTKNRYFIGPISYNASFCINRFDPLYSLSGIKCSINQSQDIRSSNVLGFDLMKKLNNKLPFLPFDGQRFGYNFSKYRGKIKLEDFSGNKPKFYLEEKNINVQEYSVEISKEDIEKAKKIKGSVQQVAMLPIIQKECLNILSKIPSDEIYKVFNRKILNRLLINDLNNRVHIRNVYNLYSYLLWYIN